MICGQQQLHLHTFARIPLPPPCPIITDTTEQNCRGGNGAVTLKKTVNLIVPSGRIVAEDVVVRAMAADLVLQSYFLVRRDGAVGATEILMVLHCEVLCCVRTVCTLFFASHLFSP